MLSPKKLNHSSSPIKQNISPTHRNPRSNIKQQKLSIHPPQLLMAAINQLQCIVLRLGGKIPNHLNFGFNKMWELELGLELKRVQCNGKGWSQEDKRKLELQIKNLKVMINNYEFQLKKLQQDQAQYKILTKLDRDKQVKRLKSLIVRLQAQIKQDNTKWQAKFTQMQQLYDNKTKTAISQLNTSHQKIINQLKTTQSLQIKNLIQAQTTKLLHLQQSYSIKYRQLELKLQKSLQKKQVQNKQQKQQQRIKHVQIVQKLQKRQQQILIGFESEKKIQNKKRDQQKISFSKLKQKLYNDLYIVRKQKQQLSKKIVELKTEIIKIQGQKKQFQYQIVKLGQKHKQELNKQNLVHIHEIEKVKHSHKFQIENIYKIHQKRLCTYSENIKNIEKLKEKRQAVLKQSCQQIEKMFSQRPPRVQDTTEINKLNYQILIKDQQLNSTKNELKQVKLERQNNQRNYTRLFSANGPRQKQVDRQVIYTSRNKDKQRVYRQANTIDMSFLLNVCNKNF